MVKRSSRTVKRMNEMAKVIDLNVYYFACTNIYISHLRIRDYNMRSMTREKRWEIRLIVDNILRSSTLYTS